MAVRLASSRRFRRFSFVTLAAVLGAQALPFLPLAPLPVSPLPAAAQACPVISGFVYYDVNDNGIKEPGEPGIPGVPMQLKNNAGATVALDTTGADGSYAFDRDLTSSTATLSESHSATFPETTTDWESTRTIPQFDPAKGTLDSVEVTVSAEITSSIEAESLDTQAQTITAEVSGTITLDAPGTEVTAVPLVTAGDFDATAYDGTSDFGGTSGHDFGAVTASDEGNATISDAASLALYTGTGTVAVAAEARATTRTTGSGNVINRIETTAAASVDVVYRYLPLTCLNPGTYTIVEVTQPEGYGDGQETAGNSSPIPNTKGTDSITVTLTTGNKPNNNFGEIDGSLRGCVYIDANNNGLKDAGESGISGVTITLGGTVSATTATGGDGCYLFPNLPPGTYTITETQPPGFKDCQETIGTQGGKVENDHFYDVKLPANMHGKNNNFGECLVPSVTPTATGTAGSPTATSTVGSSSPTGTPVSSTSTVVTSPTTPSGAVGSTGPDAPAAPDSGSGLFSATPDVRIVIAGFAIFAASGWLAFLALGRARDQREE